MIPCENIDEEEEKICKQYHFLKGVEYMATKVRSEKRKKDQEEFEEWLSTIIENTDREKTTLENILTEKVFSSYCENK